MFNHYLSSLEAIDKFKNRPLLRAPVAGVGYSSYAYTVLAAIIEKVTHQEFPLALEELIFDPLSMAQTEVDNQKAIIRNRTGFYKYGKNSEPQNAHFVDLNGRWAGSGYLLQIPELLTHPFRSH